jgi:hypothetical protein
MVRWTGAGYNTRDSDDTELTRVYCQGCGAWLAEYPDADESIRRLLPDTFRVPHG